MKERPILFSAPMVRAILEGRKTQTRRVVKPGPPDGLGMYACLGAWRYEGVDYRANEVETCPYGVPGDRLWVRETWQMVDPLEVPENRRGSRAPFTGCQGARIIPWVATYRADGELAHERYGDIVWKPSIHMPRWASRITLEITGVRVERLQDISEEDALAEGVHRFDWQDDNGECPATTREAFARLWASINGPDSWTANPWVWVVEFRRIGDGRAAA